MFRLSLIGRIAKADPSIETKLNISSVCWDAIAESVFRSYQPGTARQTETASAFAALWGRLATDFLNPNHIDEYNSLKHGFRIRSGGFALALGLEHQYGTPPPDEEMRFIGRSDYGASYIKIEALGNEKENRNIRARKVANNWPLERVILLVQLAHLSINNVVSALQVANGWKAGECLFLRPENNDDFERPWRYSTGVENVSFDFVIDPKSIPRVTRSDLLKALRRK